MNEQGENVREGGEGNVVICREEGMRREVPRKRGRD